MAMVGWLRSVNRKLAFRCLWLSLLFVYTVVAVAVNRRRAMLLLLLEAFYFSYQGLLYFRAWRKARGNPPMLPKALGALWSKCKIPKEKKKRALGACALVVAHLLCVAAMGARTSERWLPVLGLATIIGGCYACSCARYAVRWRPVIMGFLVQFWLCVMMIRTSLGLALVKQIAHEVQCLLSNAAAGGGFVFSPETITTVWAFKVLPVTLFFASLCSILLHVGFLQVVFGEVGGAMARLLGITRAEAVCAVANIFLGQTESPLLVRPIIGGLTNSQLHCVMAGGFASVAGSTLAAYILMGMPATHLLSASVLSAPAAIAISKLLHPETETGKAKAVLARMQARRRSVIRGAADVELAVPPHQRASGRRRGCRAR